jgi:dihydroneopterin aldolase
MTDRIVLADMRFEGRHGVHDWERAEPQAFDVDVELALDLRPAGESDDLGRTIDYSTVHATVREVIEGPSVRLLERLAEAIAGALLERYPTDEVIVRVRKPGVDLGGPVGSAGVEVRRARVG